MPKKIEMPSDQKAQLLLDAVEDRKAIDPILLDLRGKTLVTDFFLICAGNSNVHIRAITEFVLEKAEENLLPKPRVEGMEVGEWVLIDFGDVVLHVMAEAARERYRLEQFWTTPQPKGALPPTPGTAAADAAEIDEVNEDQMDEDDLGDEFDEEFDDEDAAFFDEADQELEPLDDEDDDLLDAENGDEPGGGGPSSRQNNGAH